MTEFLQYFITHFPKKKNIRPGLCVWLVDVVVVVVFVVANSSKIFTNSSADAFLFNGPLV